MILTCPSCGTRYVVKDGAIPPAGRTVRCAQCKHSWHQDPDLTGEGEGAAGEPVQHFPEPTSQPIEEQPADTTVAQAAEAGDEPDRPAVASEPDSEPADEEPEPEPEPDGRPYASLLASKATEATMPPEAARADDPYPAQAVPVDPPSEPEPEPEPEPERTSHPLRAARNDADDMYSPFAQGDEDEAAPRRRWPLLVGLLLLVAAIAAGLWFLAPTELKGRLGIAQGDASSRLTIQLQQSGRTQLASGNQLFEVSGTIRNETEEPITVPPLNAQLRSLEQQVVYRWTIPISPPQLAPGAAASFNSANLDVPASAACIEVFFGKQEAPSRCTEQSEAGA